MRGAWQTPPSRSAGQLLELYEQSLEFRRVVGVVGRRFGAVSWSACDRSGDHLDPLHPLNQLLAKPNDTFAGAPCRAVERLWLDLLGECFVRLLVVNGVPYYYPLNPTWVTVESTQNSTVYRVDYPNGATGVYSSEEIVHFQDELSGINPYDRPTGLGFAAVDDVELADYSTGWLKSFFYNGATPDTIIGVEGLGEAAGRKLKEGWTRRNRGVHNSHGVEFVGAKITAKQLQPALKDLTVGELRGLSADMVRSLYNVPPELVGQIEDSNRATISHALTIFGEMCLIPRLDAYAETYNSSVVPRLVEMGLRELEGLTLEYKDPRPTDREGRREVMRDHPWAFTRNEIRAEAGLGPREDGDVYLVEASRYLPVEAGELVGRSVKSLEGEAPIVLRLLPDVSTKGQIDDDMRAILEALEPERIESAVAAPIQQTLEAWALKTATDMGVEMSFDILNPFIADYMRDVAGERISKINETTLTAVRGTLLEGMQAGEGARALKKRIDELGVFGKSRAELIAITEANSAANAAKLKAFTINPAVEKVRWVTSFVNSRPSHTSMHGQVRPIGTPFVSGKGNLAHCPGGFSSAGENARCKCTIVAHFDEKRLDPDVAKAHEDDLDDAIKSLQSRVLEALTTQQDQIKAAVDVVIEEIAA